MKEFIEKRKKYKLFDNLYNNLIQIVLEIE